MQDAKKTEVYSFKCEPGVIGEFDALARREGKLRSAMLRDLINEALRAARSREPLLRAS